MNGNSRPIAYSHYQPPPQPIQLAYAQQYAPQHLPTQYPHQLEQLQQRVPPGSMTNESLAIANPFAQLAQFQARHQPAVDKLVGQDFQLFGPQDPLGGIGAGMVTDDDEPPAHGGVPDLVSDRGSPSVDSPPSPAFAPAPAPVPAPLKTTTTRPPLPSSASNGSYRGEGRASSVPPPEFPRPIRRKTQENHHWPSFVSSGSSSSSASSSSNYLPTPHQYPQSTPAFVDEPFNYALAPAPASFDPASLALSPAAQYPYSSYQAPHTDHPLLPSEQSDLLDRVRRDLLDVDLSSIKGPLRALALSGAEGTPGQFSMMSPLPSYSRFVATGGGGAARGAFRDRDKTPTPRTSHVLSPRSPAIAALAHSESAAASSIGTVSPQEAFLDYPAVDSKLHDLDPREGRLARSDFGVGVGHSLFAPLPTTTSSPLQFQPKPAAPTTTTRNLKMKPPVPSPHSSPAPTTLPNFAPPPPNIPLQPPRSSATPRASQLSPSQPGHSTDAAGSNSSPATKLGRPHGPHPFSVPQNAVSWATRRSNSGRHLVGGVVDGDADDDDGDFGDPSSSTEVTAGEDEPDGFGGFDVVDVGLDRRAAEVGSTKEQRVGHDQRPVKEEGGNYEYALAWAGPPPPPATAASEFSFVPPPAQSSLLQFASPRRSPPTSSFRPPHLQPPGSGTSTPRRAAAASALAGLQLESEVDGDEPPASFAAAPAAADASRSKRQRKRSRVALEEEDDDDDDDDGDEKGRRGTRATYSDRDAEGSSDEYKDDDGDHDGRSTSFAPPRKTQQLQSRGGDDSDESYHSSSNANTPAATTVRSGTKASGPPAKRRRRAPAAGTGGGSSETNGGGVTKAAKPNAKGSIACDFVSGDGERCGVVFRRPYDLARHKETIHGVTMGGDKLPPGKAKEWKCKECGGTFSRKDALLRHGRIRGHKPGV